MFQVSRFVMKSLFKAKYILSLLCILVISTAALFYFNAQQELSTSKALQKSYESRLENVEIIINGSLVKENAIGLTDDEKAGLNILLEKEQYIKVIHKKLKGNDLQIMNEQLQFIDAYNRYKEVSHIHFINDQLLAEERAKAVYLLDHNLTYIEEQSPTKTAIFTKQLLQLLLNPFTALLLLLLFSYRYKTDFKNRLFDFFKLQSLSSTAIYYGYLWPIFLTILLYAISVSLLAFAIPTVTGNLHTLMYPLEVSILSDVIIVATWKWLLFIPIGWTIFTMIIATIMVILFKHKAALSTLFFIISLPVIVCYFISLKLSFYTLNPVHLVMNFEQTLLAKNTFISYLLIMLGLLVALLALAYPLIKMKPAFLQFESNFSASKEQSFSNKFKLLQFEHLKKKRKGHLLLSCLLIFLLIGGAIALINQQYLTTPSIAVDVIEETQTTTLKQITQYEMLAEQFEMEQEVQRRIAQQRGEVFEPADINPIQLSLDELKNRYEILEQLKQKIDASNFLEIYRLTMLSLDNISYKELPPEFSTVTRIASEEQRLLIEERGLEHWALGEKWISNFDKPKFRAADDRANESLELQLRQNEKYDNSAIFSAYKLLNGPLFLAVMIIFLFVLWTFMADEHYPNRTIQFLRTKPISSRMIYASKWAYNLLAAYGILLLILLIGLAFTSILGGIGHLNYPILMYATERAADSDFFSVIDNAYFYFENISVLVLKGFVLVFLQIFFINSLLSFVGRIFTNYYGAIITTLVLIVGGIYVSEHFKELTFIQYNPFMYFDTWHIVDGWKSIETNNASVSFVTAGGILFMSGAILFVLGLLIKRKVKSA